MFIFYTPTISLTVLGNNGIENIRIEEQVQLDHKYTVEKLFETVEP